MTVYIFTITATLWFISNIIYWIFVNYINFLNYPSADLLLVPDGQVILTPDPLEQFSFVMVLRLGGWSTLNLYTLPAKPGCGHVLMSWIIKLGAFLNHT